MRMTSGMSRGLVPKMSPIVALDGDKTVWISSSISFISCTDVYLQLDNIYVCTAATNVAPNLYVLERLGKGVDVMVCAYLSF